MQRKSLFTPLLFISLFLTSCEFHCSMGDAAADEKTKPVEKDGMALYNGISISTKDVSVSKAYLVNNDRRAERIGEGNFVDPKAGVKLIILVAEGWKATDDRVFLGASMKVTADNGEVVLDEKDLFSASEESGLSAEDAKGIGLSVTLGSLILDRPFTFNVVFSVWDKKGSGVIDGSYTFHTK